MGRLYGGLSWTEFLPQLSLFLFLSDSSASEVTLGVNMTVKMECALLDMKELLIVIK